MTNQEELQTAIELRRTQIILAIAVDALQRAGWTEGLKVTLEQLIEWSTDKTLLINVDQAAKTINVKVVEHDERSSEYSDQTQLRDSTPPTLP